MKRARLCSTVRLYGFPGTLTVTAATLPPYDWRVQPDGARECDSFSVLDSAIVEVDGRPVPLLSLPIASPAEDWPHGRTQVLPADWEREYPLCGIVAADPRFEVLA